MVEHSLRFIDAHGKLWLNNLDIIYKNVWFTTSVLSTFMMIWSMSFLLRKVVCNMLGICRFSWLGCEYKCNLTFILCTGFSIQHKQQYSTCIIHLIWTDLFACTMHLLIRKLTLQADFWFFLQLWIKFINVFKNV